MELRMIIFLLTFFCVYGSINFYFFFRARSILHFSGLQVAILILLISLIVAPVLVRLLESLRYEQIARAVACIGYLWMAFVFLFFVINV